MRIFHIITGLNDGGAESVLFRLCAFDKLAQHHVISLMDAGKYGPLLREAKVPVTCLEMPQGRVTPSGLWRLWRLLRSEKPDAVQTWMYHADLIGGVVARVAGVRRVFWGIRHSNLNPNLTKRSTIGVARVCAMLSPVVPTRVVCCAGKALEAHRMLGYNTRKLLVIPNGYDLARFAPDAAGRQRVREELGVADGQLLLGMVGRFDPLKDHKNLLSALALLKLRGLDFVAVLVGRGLEDRNAHLCSLLQEFDLAGQLRLVGQCADVPGVMNALDLHVLSSASEGFPNVVAEAMACGTPVAVTDVGDAAAIVGHTGWVVPPRDAVALAGVIQEAYEAMRDAPAWRSRKQAARRRVAVNFGLDRMIKRYHDLWANGGQES